MVRTHAPKRTNSMLLTALLGSISTNVGHGGVCRLHLRVWGTLRPRGATQFGTKCVNRENAHLFNHKHNNMTRFV